MKNELDLFTEIFPVNIESLPKLTLYRLKISGSVPSDEIGGKLSYRLQKKFGGHWKWDDEKRYVITDSAQDESAIRQILREIWETCEEGDVLRSLEEIEFSPNDKASAQGVANFVARSLQDDFSRTIDNELAKHRREEKGYYVNLKSHLRGWVVENHPAVSVSITSELEAKIDLKTYLTTHSDPDQLKGLNVTDKTKPFQTSMPITEIVGRLGDNDIRDRLLSFKPSAEMKRLIEQAPKGEWVVKVAGKYDYVVSALKIKIHSADYARFKINERLQIEVAQRVKYIESVSSIIKESGLVGQAYSTKTHEHLFLSGNDIGYNPRLKIGNGEIVPPDSISRSLKKSGLYKSTTNRHIRIAILNTSPETPLETLKGNLRNELGKGMGYKLTLVEKERNVPNASRGALEPAIEEIAEKKPDIILGIISKSGFDADEWTAYDEFKHLTLKRDLQSQVVQSYNVNNHYIVGNVLPSDIRATL